MRRRSINQKNIDKYIASGCGQGRGADYKPWLKVQDVPSRGQVNRIKGWKTGRVDHFFSELELDYFYVLEWSQVVCDIREQYPLLPLTQTQAIASECGFRHPAVGRTSELVVMTTDFVVTMRQSIGTTEIARTLKYAKDLQSKRTLEKLEIERLYWLSRGIDWGIVTEREIPSALVKNVAWFHPFLSIENLSPLTEGEIKRIATCDLKKILDRLSNFT
ncbi:TnsA endonuclease N-terminal domain-containing protein [Nostoc commune]|uniref:TnsA endonuclease N-terminal domain-containing protein n=1 Tax=Nostoc commune TaxID=1178 RepID=UPI001FD4C77A|nr:TnsA endonuclease N-terminal domain-containing protein [Nostoc commune]